MRDVLKNVNSQIEELGYHIQYFAAEKEFVFCDLQYGLECISDTLIEALMKIDWAEADNYYDREEYNARDAERQRQDEQQYPEWLEF